MAISMTKANTKKFNVMKVEKQNMIFKTTLISD